LRSRLQTFAHQCLQPEHLKPLVVIDTQATVEQLDLSLYAQIDALHPCGIENPDPVFWSANVRICEQKRIGKGHIKLVVSQDDAMTGTRKFTAIAWRWGDYYPLPSHLDLAYRLRTNDWNGEISLELELVGARKPGAIAAVTFLLNDRTYTCEELQHPAGRQLRIRNDQGKELIVQQGQKVATLNEAQREPTLVSLCKPSTYYDVVKAASEAIDSANG
jgi:single-stranded-DNA-specific exonuclease